MVVMRTEASKQGLRDFCQYIHSIRPTRGMKLVEIGSFAGDSTEIFCDYFKHVVAIDPWESNIGDITDQVDMDEVYEEFVERLSGKGNITVLKHFAEDVVHNFGDGMIDIVYIDGKHEYKDAKKDITLWLPKVKKGGFISGHDYRKKFPGVIKAVKELIGKPDKVFADYSWVRRV